MRKLWPFVGIALAVAGGIALAPYFWWMVGGGVTLGLLWLLLAIVAIAWAALRVVFQRVDDRLAPLQARTNAHLAATDALIFGRVRQALPRWVFHPLGLVAVLVATVILYIGALALVART